MTTYLWNLLIALDQLANALNAVLHWLDPGHCERSIERDEGWNG